MSKNNRQKPGTQGRYDFGEAGYMDNLRRRGEIPPTQVALYMVAGRKRYCRKCQAHKPIAGSQHNPRLPFVCADCRPADK